MKSPFQTLESASCSSVLAGSGTPRSGRSAETLTASHGVAGGVFMHRKTVTVIGFALTLIKLALCGDNQNILIKTKKQKQI